MKTIHKFLLMCSLFDMNGETEVKMPSGAEIVHVGEQNGSFFLWAIAETENEFVNRKFTFVGTGHAIPEPDEGRVEFIKSFVLMDDLLVIHLFEILS